MKKSVPHPIRTALRGEPSSRSDAARFPERAAAYLWSCVSVGLAASLGVALTAIIRLPNVSMIFLLAVLFSAARFGMGPALVSSALSFFAYNFFFIEPRHTFSVTEPHELLALFVFLAAAILTSAIAGRMRNEARRAAARDSASHQLYEFARTLSALADESGIAEYAASRVHDITRRSCVILMWRKGAFERVAAMPPTGDLDCESRNVARLSMSGDNRVRADTTGPWLFLPLRNADAATGVVAVGLADRTALGPVARTLLETLAELTAAALERARLSREITSARMATETEILRNTFLASISHDFRTPLACILGAATSLIEYGGKLSERGRLDLLDQVKSETEHLDDMVRNLLAVTRLDAGALAPNRDWVDLREVLDRAVAAARRRAPAENLVVTDSEEMPLVMADPILLDQALANVIGNGLQHGGPGTDVHLSLRRDADEAVISIVDNGRGIPAEVLPRAFEKFSQGAARPQDHLSSGLGLAIVKGIVAAHGGSVSAASPVADGKGTRIEIRLPLSEDTR